jgi:PAS domain S-box-containing protein
MYYGGYMQQDSGVERIVLADQFIVSKTDLRGVITYANQYFMDISLYTEEELIGKPHSILRHVDMPRCVFALLWEKIQCGEEIFAYVKNRCKNGDYYWVLAYVTPEKDPHTGEIVGYFSFRRSPSRVAIDAIQELYATLRREEAKYFSKKEGIVAGRKKLEEILQSEQCTYTEFIFAHQN